MKDFITIAFTRPYPTGLLQISKAPDRNTNIFLIDEIYNDAIVINNLLHTEAIDYFHIRRPDACKEEIELIIKSIDNSFYPRLKLHSHFELCEKYNLGGIHLNKRNPTPLPNFDYNKYQISNSFHSIQEIRSLNCKPCHIGYVNYAYVTLSPIYDSISKKGYLSAFDTEDVNFAKEINAQVDNGTSVIALGGVTPQVFSELKDLGFGGAALLGYIWGSKLSLEIIIENLLKNR